MDSAALRSDRHGTAVGGRRSEVAAAAYRLIAERGLSGLSLRAVARAVGGTTGIVTHHFADRAELVEAALDHARRTMVDRFGDLPHDASLVDLAVATLPTDAEMVTSWRVWLVVRAAALHDPEMARFHRAMYDEWRAALGRAAPGGGRRAAAPDALDHVMAVVDGVALRAAHDPKAWPPRRQREHVRLAVQAVGLDGA